MNSDYKVDINREVYISDDLFNDNQFCIEDDKDVLRITKDIKSDEEYFSIEVIGSKNKELNFCSNQIILNKFTNELNICSGRVLHTIIGRTLIRKNRKVIISKSDNKILITLSDI